jgi:2-keto-4-pentenoate hydratase
MTTAAELDAATAAHDPIPRTGQEPPESIEAAYELQRQFTALRSARSGHGLAGYKVAFTSPAAQAAVTTGGYHSGRLLADQVMSSGASIRLSERFSPILEVELVIRVVRAFGADATRVEIAESTELAAGLEVPESRFADWFGGEYPALAVTQVVGDDCLAGLVVVGDAWTPAGSVELSGATAVLRHDGAVVREGSVDLVVPDPLTVIAWLAGQLAERGESLQPGQIVSSGTWTDTIVAEPGTYIAEFSAGLGSVTIDVEG